MSKQTITLTDGEIEWLYALVHETNERLRLIAAYPSYTSLHSVHRKLGALMAEISEESENMRGRAEYEYERSRQ